MQENNIYQGNKEYVVVSGERDGRALGRLEPQEKAARQPSSDGQHLMGLQL